MILTVLQFRCIDMESCLMLAWGWLYQLWLFNSSHIYDIHYAAYKQAPLPNSSTPLTPSSVSLRPAALSEPFKHSTHRIIPHSLRNTHRHTHSLFLHIAVGRKTSDHRLEVLLPPAMSTDAPSVWSGHKQTNTRKEEETGWVLDKSMCLFSVSSSVSSC